VRLFSSIIVVLYFAHIVHTSHRLLHMLRQFAQHLLSHRNFGAASMYHLFLCP